VRELEIVVERAVLLAEGEQITARDLSDGLYPSAARRHAGPPQLGLRAARKSLESDMIRQALRATEGNRTHAARLLEISHRALLYKIKEYGIRD
jgi:two-component system response regulator AtoC